MGQALGLQSSAVAEVKLLADSRKHEPAVVATGLILQEILQETGHGWRLPTKTILAVAS